MRASPLKYALIVFLAGASYGVMATTVKFAYREGFAWTQTAASQACFGLLIFAAVFIVRSLLGKKGVKLTPRSVIRLLGLGMTTCTTCLPSWYLLCAFLDDQGKPIDESTVYDPHKPFEHRDPRCTYTIVEHGTQHLGVIFDPHFDRDKVYSSREGAEVVNNDSRSYKIQGTSNQYASYNGLVL